MGRKRRNDNRDGVVKAWVVVMMIAIVATICAIAVEPGGSSGAAGGQSAGRGDRCTEPRDGRKRVVGQVDGVELGQCVKILNDFDQVLLSVPER